MMTNCLRFVSWSAVSTEEQAKKTSLEHQHAGNLKVIEQYGGQLCRHLIVNGVSRSVVLFEDACRTPGLEAYAELRQLIAERKFDVLVCLDLSRLGRTTSLILAITELCREAGIVVYETDDPPSNLNPDASSYEEMLMRAIKATGVQQEIVKFKKRSIAGRRGAVEKGKFPSRLPWGWKAEYTTDETGHAQRAALIDPRAAETIRLIFSLYLDDGWGRREIALELNRRGYASPEGGSWQKSSIDGIFRMRWRYAGYSELGKERGSKTPYVRAKGDWPAIITEGLVHQIEQEAARRVSARRSISNTYLLSGICYCERCDRPMIMATEYSKRNPHIYTYCPIRARQKQHTDGSTAGNYYVVAHRIVADLRVAMTALQDAAHRERLITARQSNFMQDVQARLSALQTERNRLEARLRKIHHDYYVDEKISASVHADLVATVEQQSQSNTALQKQAEAELAKQTAGASYGAQLAEIAAQGSVMLDDPDVKKANAWLHRHKIKVWVLDGIVSEIEFG